MKFTIYGDGASTGRIGVIGWAAILLIGDEVASASTGNDDDASNNVAEIRAIRDGLRMLQAHLEHERTPGPHELTIVSDSQYAIGVCSGKCGAKSNLMEVDAVRSILHNLRQYQITTTWKWIKGHSNTDALHDRVDRLAGAAKKRLQEQNLVKNR